MVMKETHAPALNDNSMNSVVLKRYRGIITNMWEVER